MYKIYVAVLVCFSVKAIHLEVVSEFSAAAAFLAAFDRFVARRGVPIVTCRYVIIPVPVSRDYARPPCGRLNGYWSALSVIIFIYIYV